MDEGCARVDLGLDVVDGAAGEGHAGSEHGLVDLKGGKGRRTGLGLRREDRLVYRGGGTLT